MFDLDEDIYDQNKMEEKKLNCPRTKNTPPGASRDHKITKSRWSFQHPLSLTASIYPIDNPVYLITLSSRRETLAFAQPSITLNIYKKYPEPLHSQHKSSTSSTSTYRHCRIPHGNTYRLIYTRSQENSTK